MQTFLFLAGALGLLALIGSALGYDRDQIITEGEVNRAGHDVTTLLLIVVLVGLAIYLMQRIPQ